MNNIEILDFIYNTTHYEDADGTMIPSFASLKDICDLYKMTEEELIEYILGNSDEYFIVSLTTSGVDADADKNAQTLIVANGCDIDTIKQQFEDIFEVEFDITILTKEDFFNEESSLEESFTDEVFYHGSTSSNIDTFIDGVTNWFTKSEEYAREYFEYNGRGCLYKCNLDLGKVCNIGKTGVPVFAGLKIFKYVENQLNQVGCTVEDIQKLVNETVEEGWVDTKYRLKLSTIIRSETFRKMMMEKGYDSVKTLEYSKTLGNYVECYGVFDNHNIKIIDKELVEALNEEVKKFSDQEMLDMLDKRFGQEEPYMWSTYILPNGHFLNPDNAEDYWEEIDDEPQYEHIDFEDWLSRQTSSFSYWNNVFDKYCIKMNVTYPYLSLPNNRLTSEQKIAIRKVINNGDFVFNLDDCIDRVECITNKEYKYPNDYGEKPLVVDTQKDSFMFDLAVFSVDDILKEIDKSYRTGYFDVEGFEFKDIYEESLQEKIVKKGNQYQVQSEKGRNMGTYKTKKEAEKRLNQIEYFKHINETIEKQDDVEYQGYTIVHFPYTWTYQDTTWDVDGWIIESPYYLEIKGQRHYLPLYPEDESGNDLSFKTLEEVKNYIDKYLVTDKVKLVIKHRDEVHAEVKDEFRNDLDESLNEKAEKHSTLNPKLFDENNQLKPEVHDKILEIVDEFKKGLEEDGIKINIKDIIIVGSNASYNYNDQSDVDVHIRVDTKSLDCPDNLYPLLYSAYRSIFNKKFDISFYGIPVELYIETIDEEPEVIEDEQLQEAQQEQQLVSNGIYSVLKDKWIKEPVEQDIPEVDEEVFEEEFTKWEDKYFVLINNPEINSELIDDFLEDIYDLRKTSIAQEGEYSIGNLIFKECRNLGYLDNLKDLKNEFRSKELSLEGLTERLDLDKYNTKEKLKDLAKNIKDNDTYSVVELENITPISWNDGYQVSYFRNEITDEYISKVGKELQRILGEPYLGFYGSPEISFHVDSKDKDLAMLIAKIFNQYSIWDFSISDEIKNPDFDSNLKIDYSVALDELKKLKK